MATIDPTKKPRQASNFVFKPKARYLRKSMYKKFKAKKFRKRKLSLLQRKARKVFPFKFSKKHKQYFFKKIIVRNRKRIIRRLKKARVLHKMLRHNIWVRNFKKRRKYKLEIAKARAKHVRIQRSSLKKSNKERKYYRWVPFSVPKSLKYKLTKLPRRNPYLTKGLRKAKRRLYFAKKSKYKTIVKLIPYFVLVVRKRPNMFVKAGLRQIFKNIPLFCRFISAVRIPHNGIRRKKVRRM